MPKHIKYVLQPASGSTISRDVPVTQAFSIENTMHGEKAIALRLKFTFSVAGVPEPVTEVVDVKGFAGF